MTPLIPITGENVVFMQCQFCVAGETHTVLIVPDFAYFDVQPSTSVTCLTADVVNGRRILICRGPQLTTFNLNICSDSSNCLQFPVALQECPLLEGGTPSPATPFAPGFLTPINTLEPPDDDEDPTEPASTPVPSQTPIPADKTATSTAPPPANTTEPPPTSTIAPEPTSQPTSEPTFTTGPAEFSGEGVNATPLPPPSGLPD